MRKKQNETHRKLKKLLNDSDNGKDNDVDKDTKRTFDTDTKENTDKEFGSNYGSLLPFDRWL